MPLALLAAQPALTETDQLKQKLQTLAMDADLVLDLHCDTQAVMHVYTGTPLAEAARPLGALLGAQALLVSEESGDDPFDEPVSRSWWELAGSTIEHGMSGGGKWIVFVYIMNATSMRSLARVTVV